MDAQWSIARTVEPRGRGTRCIEALKLKGGRCAMIHAVLVAQRSSTVRALHASETLLYRYPGKPWLRYTGSPVIWHRPNMSALAGCSSFEMGAFLAHVALCWNGIKSPMKALTHRLHVLTYINSSSTRRALILQGSSHVVHHTWSLADICLGMELHILQSLCHAIADGVLQVQ